jgi:hypothetical protein
MVVHRWRPVWLSLIAVLVIWVVALTGFTISKNSRLTAEKVRAYMESVDLKKLAPTERAKVIQKLAAKLNALSPEERRRARLEGIVTGWFDQMTEAEKSQFLEATLPTGFKQMLTAFEQLPEDKRRRTVEDTLRRLKEAQTKIRTEEGDADATNAPPPLSPELQAKIRTLGLSTFYSQSSAQTKAELAPVLEELQRVMESGRPFRGR